MATVAGAVHVLEGRTGNDVSPFPLRTGGKIMSSVTVLQLQANALVEAPDRLSGGGAGDTAPHLVFSSFDGYLYVVHALTGCVHKVDHGEHSYTQVRQLLLTRVALPWSHVPSGGAQCRLLAHSLGATHDVARLPWRPGAR